MKPVQAQLGHKSAVTTLDRYGHLFPDDLDQLAKALDGARRDALAASSRPDTGSKVIQMPTADAEISV